MLITPLLLVCVAVGYWVLTISQSQQKPLDLIGRILGGLIILVAIGGIVCGMVHRMRGSDGCSPCGAAAGHGCPMMDKQP